MKAALKVPACAAALALGLGATGCAAPASTSTATTSDEGARSAAETTCLNDVVTCPPPRDVDLLADFRATLAEIDADTSALSTELDGVLTVAQMAPIKALAQDAGQMDVHAAQLPGPNQESLDQKLGKLSDVSDDALANTQAALDTVDAALAAAVAAGDDARVVVLEDAKKTVSEISKDVIVNKARTQDKAFSKWS